MKRAKVVKVFVVNARVKGNDGIGRLKQISRLYHSKAAADHFCRICGYSDAYVTEKMGFDDLGHFSIA